MIEAVEEMSVRFRTARSETELGDILTRLIREDIRVTQFREVLTDLEEAFMSFTRLSDSESGSKQAVAKGTVRA